jgi:hypothetical protein
MSDWYMQDELNRWMDYQVINGYVVPVLSPEAVDRLEKEFFDPKLGEPHVAQFPVFGHRLTHEDDYCPARVTGPKDEEGRDKFKETTMPEDVRRYFSLFSRAAQEQQKIDACVKAKNTYESEMFGLLSKVTQTGTPIVAQMPNGDTYIMYQDGRVGPTVEKVQVVNL